MKKLALVSLILFNSILLFGQEVDGYYINKTGDTVRGKIQVPNRNILIVGSSKTPVGGVVPKLESDPFANDNTGESEKIDYSKLTFDFKFSENGGKFKKIDRLKVKGFGFKLDGHQYDFITWDVTSNKQIYLIPATGDVVPDGVYFILHSIHGQFPLYSLFQEVEITKKTWNDLPHQPTIKKEFFGYATKRDIIFKHPTKGLIYISNQYPLMMKFPDALKYLELEEEFIKTIDKKDNLYEVIRKYNVWKANK